MSPTEEEKEKMEHKRLEPTLCPSFEELDTFTPWSMPKPAADPVAQPENNPNPANPEAQAVLDPEAQAVLDPEAHAVLDPEVHAVLDPEAQAVLDPEVDHEVQAVVLPEVQPFPDPVRNAREFVERVLAAPRDRPPFSGNSYFSMNERGQITGLPEVFESDGFQFMKTNRTHHLPYVVPLGDPEQTAKMLSQLFPAPRSPDDEEDN